MGKCHCNPPFFLLACINILYLYNGVFYNMSSLFFASSSPLPITLMNTQICTCMHAHRHTCTQSVGSPWEREAQRTQHILVKNLLIADNSWAVTEAMCFRAQLPTEQSSFPSSPAQALSIILLCKPVVLLPGNDWVHNSAWFIHTFFYLLRPTKLGAAFGRSSSPNLRLLWHFSDWEQRG